MFHILENGIQVFQLEESRYSICPFPQGKDSGTARHLDAEWSPHLPCHAFLGVQWRRQRREQAPGNRYHQLEEREPSKQDGVWIKSETAVGVFPQGNADTICRAGDRLQGPTDWGTGEAGRNRAWGAGKPCGKVLLKSKLCFPTKQAIPRGIARLQDLVLKLRFCGPPPAAHSPWNDKVCQCVPGVTAWVWLPDEPGGTGPQAFLLASNLPDNDGSTPKTDGVSRRDNHWGGRAGGSGWEQGSPVWP